MLTFTFICGLLLGALLGHKFPHLFKWFFESLGWIHKTLFGKRK